MAENDELHKAVLKVALGFVVEETTEEFQEVDGEMKIVKRKHTKKESPPDLKAVKLLTGEEDLSCFSDERLEEEKQRLLNLLKENESEQVQETG